jgi:DNA-binding response OmpR family regulator
LYNDENILLIDDEPGLLKLLKITLEKERYKHITCAETAAQAMNLIKENRYDLIILDVMLPDFSGFDLCAEIRKITYTPIIFLTACDSDYNKLTGLAIGGDDYITKPFNPLEVVARVKAMLRRQQYAVSQAVRPQTQIFRYENFSLNLSEAMLTVNDKLVDCTAKEFDLLRYFCENPYRVFTSAQLYEAVWGAPGFGEEKTVTMHISKLRKKLGDDSAGMIVTLRGIGYKFVPPKEEVDPL